jgi:hypothetical protein
MAVPQSHSPEAAYLTKPNVVHPESTHPAGSALETQGNTKITAAEAAGRQHMADRTGATISGGSIKKGK